MMTYDSFCIITEEEVALLPDYVFQELDGGVLTDPSVYPHPGRLADDLFILGTYTFNGIMGRQIILYYGSFVTVLGNASEKAYRMRIRDTVRHEFRHHMETRAGMFRRGTLIEEDKDKMRKYYMCHKNPER